MVRRMNQATPTISTTVATGGGSAESATVRVAFARRWAVGYLIGGGLLFVSSAAAAIILAINVGFTIGFWIAVPVAVFGLLAVAATLPLLLRQRSVIEANADGVRIGLGLDHLVEWDAVRRFELTSAGGLRSIAIVTDDPRHCAMAGAGEPGARFASAFGALAHRLHDERGVLAIAVIKSSLLQGRAEEIVDALELLRRHAAAADPNHAPRA